MIRKEVLVRTLPTGIVEFLDPLLQVKYVLTKAHSEEYNTGKWSEELQEQLSAFSLLEDIGATVLREHFWSAKDLIRLSPLKTDFMDCNWEIAQRLPQGIQSEWREPERWRRLAEHFYAGNAIAILHDLIVPELLEADLSGVHWSPYQTNILTGSRSKLETGFVVTLMKDPVFQQLVSAILRVPITSNVLVHAWCLQVGDYISAHADGPKYVGTLSVGCNRNWKATNGGAISFGRPTQQGWDDYCKWLPHIGDAVLFRPRANLWHLVEDVVDGQRQTITGWWLEEGTQVHNHSH